MYVIETQNDGLHFFRHLNKVESYITTNGGINKVGRLTLVNRKKYNKQYVVKYRNIIAKKYDRLLTADELHKNVFLNSRYTVYEFQPFEYALDLRWLS